MKERILAACLTMMAVAALPAAAQSGDNPLEDLNWVHGPGAVDVTHRAEIVLPEGYSYLGPADTKTLMELMENPSSGQEYFVGPDDMRWFAVFEYEDTGHINDDEEIDPDSILESIKTGTDYSNEERRRRGWSELDIVGWQYPPFYEPESRRLAWAVLAESDGVPVVNYNTRLLGRTGVMSAVLVADPETLDSAVAEFTAALTEFSYRDGNRYSEFKPGDKVATYGLAALVAGGAAAAVTKSGVGKALIKFIGAGVIALFALVGSFLKRLRGRRAA